MKGLSIVTALLTLTSLSWADITLGSGSGIDVGEVSEPSAWVQAAGSFYTFPTVSLSAFLDTAAKFAWEYDTASAFVGIGSVNGSLSYRAGNFTARASVDAFAEGRSDGMPFYIQGGSGITLSYGTFDYAIFLGPEYVFTYYEQGSSELGGEAGASITMAETVVITAAADGFVEWRSPETREHGWGVSVESNWYPGIPVSVRSDVRMGMNRSDDVTSYASEQLYLDNYGQLDWHISVSTSVGRRMNADIRLPMRLRLKDHVAIIDGALSAESEWQVRVSPGVANSFRLSEAVTLDVGVSTQFSRSNSTYGSLNSTAFGASATVQYRLP